MNNKQVFNFFKEKDNTPCPLTKNLIEANFKQQSGGYIQYAKECNIDNPTQYWHLIESWCKRSSENTPFTKSIQCGELIFWMAEVSQAVEYKKLVSLKDLIISEYSNKRTEGNRKIQEVCFDKIVNLVENYDLKQPRQ